MSALPSGWRIVRLGDVADTALGKMLDKSKDSGQARVPYLRNVNVQWGRIDTSDVLTVELSEAERARFALADGDLLVCEGGEVGRAAIWSGTGFMAYQKALHRIRPHTELDARYLRYIFENLHYTGHLASVATGSTIKHLPQERLRELPVQLAPLAEQQRIVDILEDHLSRLEAGNGYAQSALDRLDAMRGGVLEAACTGGLSLKPGVAASRQTILELRASRYPDGSKRGRPEPTEAATGPQPARWPDHWARMSLEEVTDPVRTISYGILKPGPDIESGVPYVRVINMRGDRLDLHGLHRTTAAIASQYSRSTLASGDVLISIRGTYGRVADVPDSLAGANITQDTARLAFLDPVLPAFAASYLRTPSAQHFLKRVARGVAVKGVNITDLRAMPFPVPPLEEQIQIVDWIDEQVTAMGAVIQNAHATVRRGSVLRRALLSAAFSGDLTRASIGGPSQEIVHV